MAQLVSSHLPFDKLRANGANPPNPLNIPDLIDPALLRSGRLDVPVRLAVPDARGRREIFTVHTRGKPLAEDVDVDLDLLAGAVEGLVGSEIEGICRRAAMLAIREFVARHSWDVPTPEVATFRIAAKHFEQAMEQLSQGGE